MRHTRSLAGTWAFEPDPNGTYTLEHLKPTRNIPVPLPWQAAFPEMQHYSGYAWYVRDIQIEATELAGEVLLTFGAVDYWCEIFVNGVKAGEHEGGYTPFTLPVKNLLHAGSNQLAVRVFDTFQRDTLQQRQPQFPVEPGQPFSAYSVPHGKQEWYINVGGIWQDVTLTVVPHTYVQAVKVTPKLDGQVTVEVELGASSSANGWAFEAAILYDGQVVAQVNQPVQLRFEGTATLQVDAPRWWSLEEPNLYTLRVRVGEDETTTRFGFREITTGDGYILLNGEPLYLIAALDQDFYLDTIYTVPSEAYLRDQFKKAKELGLNCLRCHIKVPDPLYLDLADEMGLLVWAEIPSWRTFYPKGTYHEAQTHLSEDIKVRVEDTLSDMIKRDFNHPALIIWTMVNEDWGTMLPLSADDRAWVFALYDYCKQLDPTRLVVDNSPCNNSWGPNIHVQSDLDDWHVYANIPDNASYFSKIVQQLNMRALWTYSSYGDTRRTGNEPVIVSEFGNWGLASVQPYLENGQEPGWFDLGPWWSGWDGEPGWMKGVLERFKCAGLDSVFGDYDTLAKATQWHQHHALKFEIETMRRQANIMGYVITEFSDIYWECNGLLDFARRPKAYHDVLRRFNTEDIVVPQIHRYATWDSEKVNLRLHASHFSAADWTNSTLAVQINGEHTEEPIASMARGSVVELSTQQLTMPAVERAEIKTVDLYVKGENGTELVHNTLDLLVLPTSAARAQYRQPLAVIESANTQKEMIEQTPIPFAGAVRLIGYETVNTLSNDVRLAVTTTPSRDLLQWVRDGGDLLYLCDNPSPFFWAQGRGGAYGGNWMTSWSWMRPGIFNRIEHAGMNPLTMPFMHVMPNYVILGLPVEQPEYHNDILGGQFTGWLNHFAVHTVQFKYGAGRVLMTTYQLEAALHIDPVATALFHDLIDHLASERCNPQLQANW